MQIIAHRGYWLDQSEKNSLVAFKRALEYGFGIETDFRDLNGSLVVSHDLPVDGAMKGAEFIDLYKRTPVLAPIALNIKSDGLYSLVKNFIAESGITNYFVFDMSVPDTRTYITEQISFFTRMSEYENVPAFLEQSQGVWLDAFESEWYDATLIKNLLDSNKRLAIVSPELHRRPYLEFWRFLKENQFHQNDIVSLCTDFPLKAREYFNV